MLQDFAMRRCRSRCSICSHERRYLIELALVHKVPLRVIARRFDVSPDAVHRHGKNHLSAPMRAALLTAQRPTEVDLEALQRSESEGLLSQLVHTSELGFRGILSFPWSSAM